MAVPELHRATTADLAPLIQSRKLSSAELTETLLRRIETLNPRLNAFVTITADEALAAAKQADNELSRGHYRGPLHGIPMALKDLIATRGVRTTAGSKILADWVPSYDATVVNRLREAGAVLVGKTGTHEWAYGGTCNNIFFGAIHNPWDTERIPGGSSGGSGVAVASGMCPIALGSDTGGSVRGPASFCGIVGLKQTFGLVSKHGVVPLSWSGDHVGPLVRSVRDSALVLQAIVGHDPKDGTTIKAGITDYTSKLGASIKGLKIGLPTTPYYQIPDSQVAKGYHDAVEVLKGLGAEIREVPFEEARLAAMAHAVMVGVEAVQYHRPYLASRLQDYSEEISNLLLMGLFYSGADYVWSLRVRTYIRRWMADIMAQVDLLALPTVGFRPPRIGEARTSANGRSVDIARGMIRYMILANFTGQPVISVPCGFTDDNLPIGLQLMGRPFDEVTVLQAAHAYEQATPWATREPPV